MTSGPEIDWSTQGLNVCLVTLNGALANANEKALFTSATLQAYLRAEELDRKEAAVWRKKLTYEARREFLREVERVQREDKARSANKANGPDVPQSEPAGDRLPLIWTSDVSAADIGLPELVEDIFTRSGLSVTYGPSNSGKSYLSLHMDCAIARGVTVLGKRTTAGLVVYVAGEGAASIRRRLAAYKQHYGLTDFPLAIVPCAINLLDPFADVERVIAAIKRAEDHYGVRAAKTTIDTLARAFGGGNENSSEDMGAVIRNSDTIRNAIDHHLNYVHHSGKDESKGSRGHSSLRAAIDTEVECSDSGNRLHTLEIVKQRDLGSMGLRLSARFLPMDFGFDQWGKPLTVCVLEDAAAVPRPADARKLGKNQTLLLDRLRAGGPMNRHDALAFMQAAGVNARRSRYSAIDSLLLARVIEDTTIGLRAKE